MTQKLELADLDGIPDVVMVRESADDAAAFIKGVQARLKKLSWRGRIRVLQMPDGVKDPNDLHKLDPVNFKEQFRRLLDYASDVECPAPPCSAVILDTAPHRMTRPLCLIGDHAYAAAWPWIAPTSGDPPAQALVILRDDGVTFTDALLRNARPLKELGMVVALSETPQERATLSGVGVNRFRDGYRPDPADVFGRVVAVVDRFIDFRHSLASQSTMTQLIGCYVLATYLLDAFDVIGYLWAHGEKGSAKTHLLLTITELAYLGLLVLSGGSYASLRDLADYGACMGFDDYEQVMDAKKSDPDKRALLLAGNRRGTTVTVKEPAGPRNWVTRHVHAYCPRLFSAISLPDDVLGSRAIVIPNVRSADPRRAKANPTDYQRWPCDRRRLIDDLWAVGLSSLPRVRIYDGVAAERALLTGRDLEPWRGVLAVALWLQEEHGQGGLFEQLAHLSVAYQRERSELELADPARILLLSLLRMYVDTPGGAYVFAPSALTDVMNAVAVEEDLVEAGRQFTNPQRVGRLLKRLRFSRVPRDADHKKWMVTRQDLEERALSYGLTLDASQAGIGITGTLGNRAPDA
jgi:hypothetical protein